MNALNAEQVRQMLLAVCDEVIKAEPVLTEADAHIGDGDHGLGMKRGMEAARAAMSAQADAVAPGALFRMMGMKMIATMGGASGILFGTLFTAAGKAAASETELTSALLAKMMRAGLLEIQRRGGAQTGDKTMVDALAPAVQALEEHAEQPIEDALSAAETAAKRGAEASRNYVARFGRAKSLGERAIGYPDAGAVSISIIFSAMRA